MYAEHMEESVDDTAILSISLFMDNEMLPTSDEFMFTSTEQFSHE